MVCQNSAPDVGAILGAGMTGKNSVAGYIGVTAHDRLPTQKRALVHIAVIANDGVIEDPGVVSRREGQVAFALHKAAQIPGLDLAAHIPQGADAVEEWVFLHGRCW